MVSRDEPLLQNAANKYTIFPIAHQDIWDMAQTHQKAIWFDNEIDYSNDLKDWKKLNKDEKFFIKHILAFFAASDGIIMENLAANFCNEIQVAEARSFYSTQIFMENIHSIVYSKLIETYVENNEEKIKLFNAVEQYPSIRKKADWAKRWMDPSRSFAQRLVGFAIVEGVFFSGAFCSIYWLNEKGLMPALCMSNDFIARDEGLHYEFAILLYNKYVKNRLQEDDFHAILSEAVRIENEFIVESLPCHLLGMNSKKMTKYIEFIADRMCLQCNYAALYNATNPFPFMDRICLQKQTNFFDTRATEYQRSVEEPSQTIEFNEDF